jgi:hypothetical protein
VIRTHYVLAALFALSPVTVFAAKSKACNVDAQSLLGYWAGRGQFEEMQFVREDGANVFNSWLHQRPDHFGARWTISDCTLTIVPRGDLSYSYTFKVRVSGKTLTLIDPADGSVSKYRRLRDPN